MVQFLLDQKKVDIDQTGTVSFDKSVLDGATALCCAAGEGHIRILQILVSRSANVTRPSQINNTPLHIVCFMGQLDIISLAEAGAHIDMANKEKTTPLEIST
ncbi:protein fem-1 homolog B-like [Clarias gariepinus]|uniref:protein fem-1 homolog B-like n=1 Tax=Clarias gariepinus TaxID=13013 RepID=UPI00234DDB8E|nr:protein fem-1 homolog B-like [Clarias gariepinus]